MKTVWQPINLELVCDDYLARVNPAARSRRSLALVCDVPDGMYWLPHQPDEDDVIAETWV